MTFSESWSYGRINLTHALYTILYISVEREITLCAAWKRPDAAENVMDFDRGHLPFSLALGRKKQNNIGLSIIAGAPCDRSIFV